MQSSLALVDNHTHIATVNQDSATYLNSFPLTVYGAKKILNMIYVMPHLCHAMIADYIHEK